MEEGDKNFRHLVRIANTDITGNKSIESALTGIKGIGRRVSKVIAIKAKVKPTAITGELKDEEIDRLENIVGSIDQELPTWMLNRRRDVYEGIDKQLIGADVILALQDDINLMKKIRSNKGIRHERGNKVRGQKTKSTGRRGAIVGVSRRKR